MLPRRLSSTDCIQSAARAVRESRSSFPGTLDTILFVIAVSCVFRPRGGEYELQSLTMKIGFRTNIWGHRIDDLGYALDLIAAPAFRA